METTYGTRLINLTKILTLGLLLGLGIQALFAWTPPPAAAPGGAVAGPITSGLLTTYQVRNAGLGLTGSINVSNVGVQNNKITSPKFCLNNDGSETNCITAWPSGGVNVNVSGLYQCPNTKTCDDGTVVNGAWASFGCVGQVADQTTCTQYWFNGGLRSCSNNCTPIPSDGSGGAGGGGLSGLEFKTCQQTEVGLGANSANCTAMCPVGKKAVGGGCSSKGSLPLSNERRTYISDSNPISNNDGWYCRVTVEASLPSNTQTVANGYVACASESGGGSGDNLGNQIADAIHGLNMSNTTIFNLKDPQGAQDAATKAYVDSKASSPTGSVVGGCGASGLPICGDLYSCWGGATMNVGCSSAEAASCTIGAVSCPAGSTVRRTGDYTFKSDCGGSGTSAKGLAFFCVKN